jgi:hypothetical protein
MSDTKLENRMADLEKEVESLRKRVEELAGSKPWWERISGTFDHDPVYERAMKLGHKYRRAQRPNGSLPRNR